MPNKRSSKLISNSSKSLKPIKAGLSPNSKYLASFSTVKKILKRRGERMYYEQVPAVLKPSLLEDFAYIQSKQDSVSYHLIDRSNKGPGYYFALNSDVLSFAKNYDQVLKIKRSTIKPINLLHNKKIIRSRLKPIRNRSRTENLNCKQYYSQSIRNANSYYRNMSFINRELSEDPVVCKGKTDLASKLLSVIFN